MEKRGYVPRGEYLQELITELQTSLSEDARLQVLAHLANFCYDPVNLPCLVGLKIVELFLDMLSEEKDTFKEFALGGLCNLSVEPNCQKLIIENGGLSLVIKCLELRSSQAVANAITTLVYLHSDATHDVLYQSSIHEKMTQLLNNNSQPVIRNLAWIFLTQVFGEESAAELPSAEK